VNNNQALQFQAVPDYPFAVLPVGIHQIDADELDDSFVSPFPNSATRSVIADKFGLFRQVIQSLVPSEQWVDGSFVEAKENPNDVDVAVWVEASDLNSLPAAKQIELSDFCHKKRIAKSTLMTDAYLLAIIEEDHPQYRFYQENRSYWLKLFSHTRSGHPKGFISLQVPLAPPCGIGSPREQEKRDE
jgi:hypothetical protein